MPFSEIAILYTKTSPNGIPDIHIPKKIMAALEAKGIIFNWVTEDYRSKKSYDITTDSVTISTIHSAKGMDYSCVFLIGLDYLTGERWTELQRNKLVYVGMTRARHELYIPYVNDCELLNNLTL